MEYFNNPEDAFEYLSKTEDEIFLIISDMKMPKLSGMELKKIIDNDKILAKKAIPFIFTTNAATEEEITEAHIYRVQGYFKKADTIDEQAEMLDSIIKYWINSR